MRLRSTLELASTSNRKLSFQYVPEGAQLSYTADVQKDLEFAGGILHIVDRPMAPPYTLRDTGTVLGIDAIANITQANVQGFNVSRNLTSASDITVFAPLNLAPDDEPIASPQVAANYVVSGPVLYSTALTAGKSITTIGKTKLVVTTGANGAIFVNGSRIIASDILTANGVVHVIEE